MHFSWTALFVVICFSVSGIQCLVIPFQFEEEIDNISDSSDDIIIKRPQKSPVSTAEENEAEASTNATELAGTQPSAKESEPCPDPQVYGMNIGLHYILEDIKKREVYGDKVHLESLIKVLVLTHKIEKANGSVEDNNKRDLRKVVPLYPEALREAMKS